MSTQLLSRRVADTGPLNLDHVGAEPGQQLRAGRPGLDVGKVENLDAFESFHRLPVPISEFWQLTSWTRRFED